MQPGSSPGHEPAEILLLRHAATSWNDQHRRQGWSDQPLTPAGRAAAAEWARRAPPDLTIICSSDLQRARDTARIIADELGVTTVGELRALREQDQGAWTGLTKAQIKRTWPERLRERPRRPVGGETSEAVLARVLPALRALAVQYAGVRVLAITHSGVIRGLERAAAVHAPPVPHLEGRWFKAGSQFPSRPGRSEWLMAAAPTDGRAGAARTVAGGMAAELS
ncbi:MAG: histidine phosphatase family protein [Solirubrobacteraceae bacterium]